MGVWEVMCEGQEDREQKLKDIKNTTQKLLDVKDVTNFILFAITTPSYLIISPNHGHHAIGMETKFCCFHKNISRSLAAYFLAEIMI
jgi:hypothetical protein